MQREDHILSQEKTQSRPGPSVYLPQNCNTLSMDAITSVQPLTFGLNASFIYEYVLPRGAQVFCEQFASCARMFPLTGGVFVTNEVVELDVHAKQE